MNRSEVFARDEYRCVYCGELTKPDELSVDHVQPRMRGGDGSPGNVVSACRGCNTRKAGRPLAQFLAEEPPETRRNFFERARYVWARHLKAVAEELVRRGIVDAPSELVEGVRRQRGSEAIAEMLRGAETPPETQDQQPGTLI
jgi:hypothetical protein